MIIQTKTPYVFHDGETVTITHNLSERADGDYNMVQQEAEIEQRKRYRFKFGDSDGDNYWREIDLFLELTPKEATNLETLLRSRQREDPELENMAEISVDDSFSSKI